VATDTQREGMRVAEMQRRRLLLATGELVGEGGLESASVGRICKRAGVSRRTFYEQFEEREGCVLATVQFAVGRLEQSVLAACTSDAPWQERMRAAVTAALDRFDAEPGLARLCLVETLKGSPEVLAYRREVLVRLNAAVDEGRGEASGEVQPAALTAEGTVGGVLSVLHTRLLQRDPPRLTELVNPLMSMIVQPYLGPEEAERERRRPTPKPRSSAPVPGAGGAGSDPFRDLPIRFTYRTARVLATIAAHPGASNRQIGDAAGIVDQGQTSKLLRRLEKHELIANQTVSNAKGEANAWLLTPRGHAIQVTIDAKQVAA
jgi:AcrR family transcriptional regulator